MLAILTTHPIQYQVPLWQALAKDGRVPFEVWYLTSHAVQVSRDREFQRDFAWDLDSLKGYPHRFLKTPQGASPNTFWRCRIAESLPDLFKQTSTKAIWIQGWQVAGYWQAAWAAKRAGIEVWLRGESNNLAPVPWWKASIKRLVLGQLFKRVDRFLYIGAANRRLYEKFGVPNDKLYPAPYAVDNERFAFQASALRGKRKELRKQWSIPEESFCILFCGKFIPKKRPMDIVEAAKLLMQSKPDVKVHLLFAGSGELGAQLRSACNVVFDSEQSAKGAEQSAGDAPLGSMPLAPSSQLRTPSSQLRTPSSQLRTPSSQLQTPSSQLLAPSSDNREQITDNTKPRASFAGFLNQTEVSKAYVAADILVLPSDYGETWGLVVNEAMASGLACIVSDRCGCAEDLATVTPNSSYHFGNVIELADRLDAFRKHCSTVSFSASLKYHSLTSNVETVVHVSNPQ